MNNNVIFYSTDAICIGAVSAFIFKNTTPENISLPILLVINAVAAPVIAIIGVNCLIKYFNRGKEEKFSLLDRVVIWYALETTIGCGLLALIYTKHDVIERSLQARQQELLR